MKRKDRPHVRLDTRRAQELTGLGALIPGLASDLAQRLEDLALGMDLASADLPPDTPGRHVLEDLRRSARDGRDMALRALQLFADDRLVVEPCDLSAVISDLRPLLDAAMPPGLGLRFHLGFNLPQAHADAARVAQLVVHLVIASAHGLAGDAVGRGTVSISSGVLDCDRDRPRRDFDGGDVMRLGSYVYLEVRSDGPPPPERWREGDAEDPRPANLLAALELARRYYGGLRVDVSDADAERPGMVTTVLLPVMPVDEGDDLLLAPGWHAGGMVLVVDPDERARTAVVSGLERLGFEILTTDCAERGLKLLGNNAKDVVLLIADLDSALEDDSSLVRRAREISGGLPILLAHPRGAKPPAPEGLAKDGLEVVHKPFRRPSLRSTIRRLLAPEDPP